MRENFRARINENVVTIMAGSPSGTDLAIVQDLASVLDDGDKLRVLPMVGKGPEQNIKDVMFLRGVDMGVTQANLLKHFDKTGELGPNLQGQIAYIAKLFNEELHILVRSEVNDIHELNGKYVNFGAEGSGAEITGRLIFAALGVDAQEVHLNDADAIQKLKAGDIDATIALTGKPAPVLAALRTRPGSSSCPCRTPSGSRTSTIRQPSPMTTIPQLIPTGGRVDTLSVCAVLVSFNWPSDLVRYAKIGKFVDQLLLQFRFVPGGAASSEMARGQFRGDAGRLEALAVVSSLDRPGQGGGFDRQRLAQPFRCVPGAGKRHARHADLRYRARRSVPGVPRVE